MRSNAGDAHPGSFPLRKRDLLMLGLTALLVGLLLVAWSVWESRRQRRQLEGVLRAEGEALVEALGHAVENALASAGEIEELAAARLLDVARLVERLDLARGVGPEEATRLADELALYRIALFDGDLATRINSRPWSGAAEEDAARREVAALARGEADIVVLPPAAPVEQEGARFAAGVRRGRGGAVLVEMDAAEMLAFRDATGAAHLIDAVAGTGGILDARLVGPSGERLAAAGTRPGAGEGALVLDRPVVLPGGGAARLEVGLSTEALRSAEAAARRRHTVTALVGFGLALAVGVAMLARRRAARLHGETARVRSIQEAVLEGMEDAVVVIDLDHRVVEANGAACALLRTDRSGLVGRSCRETPCADLPERLTETGTGGLEARLALPGAAERVVLATASPVRDETGRVTGTTILMRDVTERRRLEGAARRTESLAAFGRLAAAVAHEVRNPLNAIAVGVQRLEREFAPGERPEDHRRLTALLRGEIARLDGIVGRFLDLARPPQIALATADLAASVAEVLPLLEQSCPEGVTVELASDGPSLAVFDPAAVRQILLNLVRNAVEAAGDVGRIRIGVERDGEQVMLEVEDDGPGIGEADLERIFEFGFSTKPKGSGLGLPTVQRLAAEMGAAVTAGRSRWGGARIRVAFAPPAPR